MRKLVRLFLLVYLTAVAAHGALYDPFLLDIHCDPHLRYCFVGKGSVEPIFYFSSYKHGELLRGIINQGRATLKMVNINVRSLATKAVQVQFMHSFIWSNVHFYRDCCAEAQAVSVSKKDIDFDWEDVDKLYIKSKKFLPQWVTFTVNGKSESYWLSVDQKKRLDQILAAGGESVKVNFSALSLFSIYRDAIPLDRVFATSSSINDN